MTAARCTFCERPIDEDRDYRKVTGFERRRAQGGTNALRLREPHDEWACVGCVGKQARDHVNAYQETMI